MIGKKNPMLHMMETFDKDRASEGERSDEAYLPSSSSYGGGTKMMKLSKFQKMVSAMKGKYVTVTSDGEVVSFDAELQRSVSLSIGGEDTFDYEEERKKIEKMKSEAATTAR